MPISDLPKRIDLHGYERLAFFDHRDDAILYLERATVTDVEDARVLFLERAKEPVEPDPEPIFMRWVTELVDAAGPLAPQPGSWVVCSEEAEGAVPFWREPALGIGWGRSYAEAC